MIQQLSIKNFQSHHDTTLNLEPFTVIVGQSNAGKSAIVRALKGLTSNLTGTRFITHGESTAQISVKTDKGTLTLTKGKPEDSYVILSDEDPKNPRRYTKLGGSVPEDVTAFLGIEPKDAINFAGQFDMPFLLKTSAAEVARTLGELTNVSVVFEASREALRRKNEYATKLKTRTADQEALAPRVANFENLDRQDEALTAAEEAYNAAERVQNRLRRLDDITLALTTARNALSAAESRLGPLPDLAPAVELLGRLHRLDGLIVELQAEKQKYTTADTLTQTSQQAKIDVQAQIDATLREAGTCPTCHQSTEGLHTHE